MNATWPVLAEFLNGHMAALGQRTAEHLLLTGAAVSVALVVAVTLAALCYRHAGARNLLLGICGMLQTVPGIALLVIMLAMCGRIGMVPALCALILYALLPIVQNTLVGLHTLDPSLAEAARGLGLSWPQRMRLVRLPLALPMILAGLRTATVQTVGLATLAAFIGAGGLGQFINRGLFLSDTKLILLGAIPAAMMALLFHLILGAATVAATPARSRRQKRWAAMSVCLAVGMAALFTWRYLPATQSTDNTITIGSKNFTEQLIIAEMVAQHIEANTSLNVTRRLGLGGSLVMHRALVDKQIDLAVEYTGTALTAILHHAPIEDPARVFPTVRDAYEAQYGLHWFEPLGFNNGYVLAMASAGARHGTVQTISQLVKPAASLTAAFDFEFAERQDGYAGLRDMYGLKFARVVDMHPDLMYAALRRGEVDVISAYATDGRLTQSDIRTLVDDRHFFPPYEASIVVHDNVLRRYPELISVLADLSAHVSNERMRDANAAVDQGNMSVEEAAASLRNP